MMCEDIVIKLLFFHNIMTCQDIVIKLLFFHNIMMCEDIVIKFLNCLCLYLSAKNGGI